MQDSIILRRTRHAQMTMSHAFYVFNRIPETVMCVHVTINAIRLSKQSVSKFLKEMVFFFFNTPQSLVCTNSQTTTTTRIVFNQSIKNLIVIGKTKGEIPRGCKRVWEEYLRVIEPSHGRNLCIQIDSGNTHKLYQDLLP